MTPAVPEASLQALMHLLVEQSLLAMGVPHPAMKEAPPANVAAARLFVDLLAVLKDKTEGRRTEEETREIEDLLYGLRLRVMDLKPAQNIPVGPQP